MLGVIGLGMQEILVLLIIGGFGVVVAFLVIMSMNRGRGRTAALEEENRRLREENARLRNPT